MVEGNGMQVAGNDVKSDVESGKHLDLQNRDPDDINGHLSVAFEEIFAEPHPSIFSFDKIWQLSYTVFTGSKLWCYRITSAICALPAACCWGITFACISFNHIWCCVPGLKAFTINLRCVKVVFDTVMDTFCAPLFFAYGKIFSSIHVTIAKE